MKHLFQVAAALLIAGSGGTQAMANGSVPHRLYWRAPILERTVVTTTIVRQRGDMNRTETIRSQTYTVRRGNPPPVAERTVTTQSAPGGYTVRRVVYRSGPSYVGERLVYSSRPPVIAESVEEMPPPVGERVEVPVVGGRKTVIISRTVRTTPTPVGEGPTEPGPTVAPAYPNAWVDYNNPYR